MHGLPINPKNFNVDTPQSPLRIMVWACVASNSKGLLVILEYPGGGGGGGGGIMMAARYKEQVLEPLLVPLS